MIETNPSFTPPERAQLPVGVVKLIDAILSVTHLGTHPGISTEQEKQYRLNTLAKLNDWLKTNTAAIQTASGQFWREAFPNSQTPPDYTAVIEVSETTKKVELLLKIAPLPFSFIKKQAPGTPQRTIHFANEELALTTISPKLINDLGLDSHRLFLQRQLTSYLPTDYGVSIQHLYFVAKDEQLNYDEYRIQPGVICKIAVSPNF